MVITGIAVKLNSRSALGPLASCFFLLLQAWNFLELSSILIGRTPPVALDILDSILFKTAYQEILAFIFCVSSHILSCN